MKSRRLAEFLCGILLVFFLPQYIFSLQLDFPSFEGMTKVWPICLIFTILTSPILLGIIFLSDKKVRLFSLFGASVGLSSICVLAIELMSRSWNEMI